jgi:hypothetical protein
VRRSLVLDAFANAEHIDGDGEAATDDQVEARSARALERLVELATGAAPDGQPESAPEMATVAETAGQSPEKPADQSETTDTGSDTRDADAPATPEAEEERGTA